MGILDNANFRATVSAVIAGVLAAIVPLQQGLGADDTIYAFLLTALPLLAVQYGTPLNKSVGLGREPLDAEGEPIA